MTTSEQMRHWSGPALFSYGFRPFFLFGALWAALAMTLWSLMLSGVLMLPTRLDPISWHAHEFLFGYLGAIIAGFLLTAVPNWTGRLPVVGWQLALLFAVWATGRAAIAFGALLPAGLPEAIDLAFPVLLAGLILREIIAGKNWRNMPVLALLAVFTLANLAFHIEAARGGFAAEGIGLRLGVGAVLMMIALIGGRIIPSFTRNWLVARGATDLPTPPMQTLDKITLLGTGIALLAWIAAPNATGTGAALFVMGVLHLARLLRWKAQRTLAEPLLWILHLAYLLVPLGALAQGAAILAPDALLPAAAQHLWMAGAFALMTLAVMARATLGHTGQALTAGRWAVAMFAAILAAVAFRLGAGLAAGWAAPLQTASALCWIAAFLGFALLYGRLLIAPKPPRC